MMDQEQGQPKGQDQPKGQGQGQPHGQGQAQAKTKAQLKAERRAIQEAQRAAKQGKLTTTTQDSSQNTRKHKTEPGSQKAKHETPQIGAPRRVPNYVKVDDDKVMKKMNKKLEKQQIPQRTVAQRKVGLFNHLHQYERELSLTQAISFATGGIHPAILRLGLQYAEGVICGSNARSIALLAALKQVIADYSTPPHKEMSRDLDARIKPYISFLGQCRPLSVSMGRAIKHIKWHINHLSANISDAEAKRKLYDCIEEFVEHKIILAAQRISTEACTKIHSGDVIMVYACSSLVLRVLCDAHDGGKSFTVIVVDSRPKLEGREMLRRLVKAGVKCSYVLINAASYVIKEVDKVLLGAHALLANGCVMSRVGSSQVALVAKAYNVPVLVCCETYKFCERVQTDSFVFNELGDPDDLVKVSDSEGALCDWRDLQCLSLLHLVYDVTPSQLIAMVITEIGMMPCTSVPVVLRLTNTTE